MNDGQSSGVISSNGGSGTTAGTPGTITKSGSGTFYIAGINTYTGPTVISAGTLKLGNTSALGTTTNGTSITSGAVLDLNGINYSNAEALTINGTGISNGGAIINSSSTGATFAGLITLGSSSSIVGGTGTISISNAGTITGSGYGLTLGGAVGGTLASILGTGTATLTKVDAGTWTISGNNTYTGATTISAGTLKLGASERIANTSALIVNGTFDMNGYTETVGSLAGSGTVTSSATGTITLSAGGDNTSTTYSGIIQNGTATSVAFTKTGTGALTFSGINTFTGGATLSAGTLNINNASALGNVAGTFTINGGTIDNTSGSDITTLNYSQTWGGNFSFTGTNNLNLGIWCCFHECKQAGNCKCWYPNGRRNNFW